MGWYAITDLYLIDPFTRQEPPCDERTRLQILEQAPRAPTSGSEEGGAGKRDCCRPSVGQSVCGGLSSVTGAVQPAIGMSSGEGMAMRSWGGGRGHEGSGAR